MKSDDIKYAEFRIFSVYDISSKFKKKFRMTPFSGDWDEIKTVNYKIRSYNSQFLFQNYVEYVGSEDAIP